MRPETWLLTSTLVGDCRPPVAVTTWTTSPRATVMVEYSGTLSELRIQKYHPPAATAATAMMTMRVFQALERSDVAMMVKKGKEIDAAGCQGKANHRSGCEAGRQPISRW